TPVTITSSDGWDTNLDNLVVDSGVPDFTFSASPATQTMGLTGSVQFSALVEFTGGFNPGTISLFTTNLPAGVSGVYSPNPLPHEGASVLTLTGDGTSTPGSYSITLGATAGSVTHSQVVTLIVSSQPDFSLASAPL